MCSYRAGAGLLLRTWLGGLLLCVFLTGCSALPAQVARPVSTALAPGDTVLRHWVPTSTAAAERKDSAFSLVSSADLAFNTRMALIESAQNSLDVQYYAIFFDDTTERLLQALRDAGQRGVRVRVLLDDFNTSDKNALVLKLGFEKNIELRLFNPLAGSRGPLFWRVLRNLADIPRIQRRMHNKALIADDTMVIVGGRNLGETYFGQSKGSNFVDIDMLAAGPVVQDFSSSFDQYWNHPLSYPVRSLITEKELQALQESELVLKPPQSDSSKEKPAPVSSAALNRTPETTLKSLAWTWAPAAILADKPSKISADIDEVEESPDTTVNGLLHLMSKARSDILVVSPYFVPGQGMMEVLHDLRARGVRIRVLTNSLASNDALAAHVGYSRYREALLDSSVELYEMRAEQKGSIRYFGSSARGKGPLHASLHAKAVVIDQRILVVGSMNLDLRSALQNSEVALVMRSRTLSDQTTQLIERTLKQDAYRIEKVNGQLVWRAPKDSGLTDSTTEPDTSLSLRLLVQLLRPFAPEEML